MFYQKWLKENKYWIETYTWYISKIKNINCAKFASEDAHLRSRWPSRQRGSWFLLLSSDDPPQTATDFDYSPVYLPHVEHVQWGRSCWNIKLLSVWAFVTFQYIKKLFQIVQFRDATRQWQNPRNFIYCRNFCSSKTEKKHF